METRQDVQGQRAAGAGVPAMTAIIHDKYGTVPADVLRLAEADRPAIGGDEVLVAVRAASVDRGTWRIMAGLPYPVRVAGFGLRKPKYLNPGWSLAGTVEAVGGDITGFRPGDEVYGVCDGSCLAARPRRSPRSPTRSPSWTGPAQRAMAERAGRSR